MSESDGLRLGKIAVSRIFRDESKLKSFLKLTQELRINLETCDFRQVESFVRELSSLAGAIPARGGEQSLAIRTCQTMNSTFCSSISGKR
jgi:hypothetical protein